MTAITNNTVQNNDTVNIVRADNISVSHGFFGRNGGFSENSYNSLNCSDYVGDLIDNVQKNLDVVKKNIAKEASNSSNLKLITLKQIHSNICLEVSRENFDNCNGSEADALVTKDAEIALGILTADCAPILFYDAANAIIGAAHAGWRGALNGVIDATVKKMCELGSNPANIAAAIGPCIGKDSYEIDDDFKRGFSGSGDCFCLVNYHLHFDLLKFCKKRLIESGIKEENIETIAIDTFANPKDYFSYRFANQNSDGICGRQISAICL